MSKVFSRMKIKFAQDPTITADKRSVNNEAFAMLENIVQSRLACDQTNNGNDPKK
jgi:hypothetical protein